MNLPELTKTEQSLLWDQGHIGPGHPKAAVLLTIAEALKTSGYDWATVLNIFKIIQQNNHLPKLFSIVNNKFLVFTNADETSQILYNLDSCEYTEDPAENKLIALTFWI